MLFQTLDEKEKCVAIFLDGELSKKEIPQNLTKTWSYSSFLKSHDVLYANLYCNGKTLTEVCPEELSSDWERISDRLKAFYRSFVEAKVSLNDNCFFDLVPEQFLLEFCDLKNKITEHVLDEYEKPTNYEFLEDLTKLVTQIKYQPLNIDLSPIRHRMTEYKTRQFCKKINRIEPYVKYNVFGTKTGRLTTVKNSFPILTLDKTYRSIVKPKNDWFMEFDYNAAELRTLLALANKEQPAQDMHEWNVENLYNGNLSRKEAKERVFAWLYNPNSKDTSFSKAYEREEVLKRYWDGKCVKTHYDREIEADAHHALNYIIQSTFSDLMLRQTLKLSKILNGRKSQVAFMIHDSVVIDLAEEDADILNDLYHTFADTEFGAFKTNATAGKNFGEMKELWIKY
tara:strand:+ start:574 stop:1767 length:1194 start_codon:yes stop_codon:yes gene_type:complete